MLLRIAAGFVDGWLAVARLARRVQPAWRALPGDLIGRSVIALCGANPNGRQVGDAVVVEDPRLALYLDHVPLKPTAQTLGRYVVARGRLSEAIVRHEQVHVVQWSRYGPFYLPLYGLASILAILAGRHRYHDNPFEMAARSAEAEPPAGV